MSNIQKKQNSNIIPKDIQSEIYSQFQQQLAQQNLADMPNKVQQILPALSEFNETDYNYLYNLLINLKVIKNQPVNEGIESETMEHSTDSSTGFNRLGHGYFGKVTINDDFTDELDDDLWGF